MSYKEDFNEIFNKNEKIPYDNTPISRKTEHKPTVVFKKPSQKNTPVFIKTLVATIVVLFVFNVAMMGALIWSISHGGKRYINVYYNSVEVSGEADNIVEQAYQKARYSSVCVSAGGSFSNKAEFFALARSRGSGVILSKNEEEGYLYVLTCQHVIDGYEKAAKVLFPSYDVPVSASVVGYSVEYDLAVLKVTNLLNLEPCVAIDPLENTQLVTPGDAVFAVGNSIAGGPSVTRGIVSRQNYEIGVSGATRREIQIDAPVNAGNSGCGLFNAEGKYIGTLNAKLENFVSSGTNHTAEGTAYAIPGTYAVGIAMNIIRNEGFPQRATIGVYFTHDSSYPISPVEVSGKFVDNYRVLVGGVSSGSDASGRLRKNDEVLSFTYWSILDGKQHTVQMFNEFCFEDVTFLITPGSEIEFNVRKNGISGGESVVKVVAKNFTVQK